jgi:hypothetical protein
MKPAKFHPAVKSILRAFPEDIRREIGKAIFELQKGIKLECLWLDLCLILDPMCMK